MLFVILLAQTTDHVRQTGLCGLDNKHVQVIRDGARNSSAIHQRGDQRYHAKVHKNVSRACSRKSGVQPANWNSADKRHAAEATYLAGV